MCQQTRIETVKDYYKRFMEEIKDIFELSRIEDDRLYKLWEGLGYYSRAKNLSKGAKMIIEKWNGNFPLAYHDVLSIPGIGEYTAGAILSIAYNQPFAAVDGNVLRITSRLLMDENDIKEDLIKKKRKEQIEAILPPNSGDFNQSLMDLGALICVQENPKCQKCPISHLCLAFKNKVTSEYPFSKKKTKVKNQKITVFVEKKGREFHLCQINEKLLNNLYSFPFLKKQLDVNEVVNYYQKPVRLIMHYKHVFTHLVWDGFLFNRRSC